MSSNNNKQGAFDHIIRGAFVTIVGNGIGILLGFLSKIILTRQFGVTVFGRFQYGLTILNIGVIFGTVGLTIGVNRFISISDTRNKIIGTYTIGIIISTVISGMLGAMTFFLASDISAIVFESNDSVIFIQMAGILLPIAAVYKVSLSATRGFNYSAPNSIIEYIIFRGSKLAGITIVAFIGLGSVGLATTLITAYVITAIFSVLSVIHILRIENKVKKNSEKNLTSYFGRLNQLFQLSRELIKYSLPLLVTGGLALLMNSADTLLIGFFLGESDVGIYSVAFSLAVLLKTLQGSFGSLFLTNISKIYDNEEYQKLNQTYLKTTTWLTVLSVPILIGNIGFPAVLLSIFGAEFTTGAHALIILTVGLGFHVILGLNGSTIQSIGDNSYLLYIQLSAALFNILLNIALIPRYGITGAAAGSAIAYILSNILMSAYLYVKYQLFPFNIKFTAITILFLSLVIWFGRTPIFADPGLFTAIIYGMTTYTIYIILIQVYGSIDIRELLTRYYQ